MSSSMRSRGTVAVMCVAVLMATACTPTPAAPPTAAPKLGAPASAPPVAAASPKPAEASSPKPAASVSAVPASAPKPVVDPSLAPTWSGKTITFIAGSTAGSGYDTWARLFARFMGKYLPGSPNTIVQNMPGAGHAIAANFVYESKPDGLTVGVIDRGIVQKQLLKEEGVRYDATKINFLGSPTTTTQVLATHARAGFTSAKDPETREIRMGLTDAGGQTHADAVALRTGLGWKMKLSFGYKGGPEVRLGMDRGEIDGLVNDWDTLLRDRGDDIRGKTLIPLIQIGAKIDDPLLVGVPTADELFANKSAEDKQLLTLAQRPLEMGRMFVTSPNLDPKVLTTMQAAFLMATEDPELLAEAERLKLTISPVRAEKMRELVTSVLAIPPAAVERFNKLLAEDTP